MLELNRVAGMPLEPVYQRRIRPLLAESRAYLQQVRQGGQGGSSPPGRLIYTLQLRDLTHLGPLESK